jgi:hypothetical protein
MYSSKTGKNAPPASMEMKPNATPVPNSKNKTFQLAASFEPPPEVVCA